jgi:hypothetical protein
MKQDYLEQMRAAEAALGEDVVEEYRRVAAHEMNEALKAIRKCNRALINAGFNIEPMLEVQNALFELDRDLW